MSTNKFAEVRKEALAHAHRAALRPALYDSKELRDTLKMFPVRLRKNVSMYPSAYSSTVQFCVTLRDLDSLKDKRLASALEPFTTEPDWTSSSTDYTYDTPNRDFTFRRVLNVPMKDNEHTRWLRKHGHLSTYASTMPVEVVVFISAYVKADSAACRIEVVDRVEEVVVKEVKRIVCA